MNANSKKLLSLVVAIALVLSMAPAISLQADAVEFDPTGTVCDHCGGAAKVWKELAGGSAPVTLTEGGHYYLSSGLSGSSGTSTSVGILNIASNIEVCLYADNYQIKNSRGTAGANGVAVRVTGGGTLNYMGTGTISGNANSSYGAAITVNNGTVNLYGGTLENRGGDYAVRVDANGGTVTMHEGVETAAKIFLYGTAGNAEKVAALNIDGGTYTNSDGIVPYATGNTAVSVTGGTFSFDPSTYVPATHAANDNGDGTWTVTEYVAPELPTDRCPMCQQENVTWQPVTAVGTLTTGHYYLKNNIEGSGKYLVTVESDNAVCLNLNGNNITSKNSTNGPVALYADGGTLRVMGTGIVSTPNVTPEEGTGKVSWGTVLAKGETAVVEIYGGTYIDSNARDNAVRSTGTLNVYGGTFSSKPSAFVPETHWVLPNADKWSVEELKDAAFIKADGYTSGTAAEVVSASDLNGYILIGNAVSIELTKDAYVDNAGKAVTVTGDGKLYAMDSVGNGTWTAASDNIVRDVTNPITNERFLTVGNESYEFELKLTQVVLRAGTTSENMGLYYKATIDTSDELADLVEAYGAVFSLISTPNDTFFTDIKNENGNVFTMIETEKTPIELVEGSATMTSGSIFGIMSEKLSDYTDAQLAALNATTLVEANKAMGEKPIYANAYIALDLYGDGTEDYIMASNSDAAHHSLKDVMVAINAMESIPAVVKDFYGYWAQYGMNAWAADLGNIAA